MKKRFLLVAFALLLSACCPLAGQLMKISEGIKFFAVREGQLSDIRSGGTLLVFAPFAKSEQAYFICKGELEEQFAVELTKAGLFQGESYLERRPAQLKATIAALRNASGEELQQQLQLQAAPLTVLFGTLLEREATVAPLRGVVMEERYLLEFYNVASKRSVKIEVAVRDLAEKSISALVAELQRELASK
jgi:hypothetical protein